MAIPVGRGDVQALLAEGALLIEVLEPEDYARAHLPGAVNVPASLLTPAAVSGFDRRRPTVVYCEDLQSDLSARSARLLEHYGFEAVRDYEAGKADWLAYGLPYEGDGTLRAGDLLEPCMCALRDEAVGLVRDRMDASGFDRAVVVDDGDIVLGAVSRLGLEDAPADAPLHSHMVPSPVTHRPTVTASDLARELDDRGLAGALVTTASGRLLGCVSRARLAGGRSDTPGRFLARAGAGGDR